jgi:hypothetical protein
VIPTACTVCQTGNCPHCAKPSLCPRCGKLHECQRGLCLVRACHGGAVVLTASGRSSGFCVGPIEKRPLDHFLPGIIEGAPAAGGRGGARASSRAVSPGYFMNSSRASTSISCPFPLLTISRTLSFAPAAS